MGRSGVAAVGLLVAVALSGCSVGSHASSSPSSATTSSTADAATTGTGAATGTGTGSGTGTGTEAGTGTGTASSDTTSATRAGGHHGKGKKGDGLPAAPDGLAQTAGYATYERCAGTCTGSVPASLRRPLHLPSDDGGPCPITITPPGPASPRSLPAQVGFTRVSGSAWSAAPVTWAVSGAYTGPLLIRGELLGGSGAIGFGTGATPYDELQLSDAGQGAPRIQGGGRAWITEARVQSSGCYAYQVDGTTFSEVVVFRAVA